jgi:hypothetical protein
MQLWLSTAQVTKFPLASQLFPAAVQPEGAAGHWQVFPWQV